MTAQSVGIFTIEFPDPYTLVYDNDKFVTLGSNISFQYPITSNIQTLSTKNADQGNDPYGILYVPELQSDGCKSSERQYVPTNATRIQNLPQGTDYALIGFFPWFSPACVLEYFKSARASPVKALLVYQPNSSDSMPPTLNDPSWTLGDGGGWKTSNDFPAYALSSATGGVIMQQLSHYSGNITDAPHGQELASLFSPTDYVRLWATIDAAAISQLPNLWVFLVIVLGILILIIFCTSVFMHTVQRRRRRDLQRRVINGEVDLEAVGVKRLTVPREYLEKLPLYTYSGTSESAIDEKAHIAPITHAKNLPSPTIEAETGMKLSSLDEPSTSSDINSQPTDPSPTFSQPTCPICLDDFEANETQVRELPCRHIFHPDCVDTFLLSNSSLCPMCKASVLPTGYCPARITNVMVRRERMIRRMRAQNSISGEPVDSQRHDWRTLPLRFLGGPGPLINRIGGTFRGRRATRSLEHSRSPDIEMATPGPNSGFAAGSAIPPATPPPIHAPQSNTAPEGAEITSHRNERARERAQILLGNSQVPGIDEEEQHPRWQRWLRKIFPGFR